jgi:KUP system potassium uptake protein
MPHGLPRGFLHNLKNNRVLHRRVVFLTVLTEEVPTVPDEERVTVGSLVPEEVGEGFWRVVARYGFMEQPAVPAVLRLAEPRGLPFRPSETNYFLGRETIVSSDKPGMAQWRERLFGVMHRNALPATAFFGLPPNRVMELGAQVEI